MDTTNNNVSQDSEKYFNEGVELLTLGKYEEAINDFNNINDKDFEQRKYYHRGFAYLILGKYEEAINDFNNINDKDFEQRKYYHRGFAYLILEKYEEAINDFNNINNKDFEQRKYYHRGFAYLILEKYEEAINDFNNINDKDFEQRKYYHRGFAYLILEKYEEAINDFNNINDKDFEQRKYYHRGFAYLILEKYEEAINDFKNIEKETPFSKVACNLLGKIYLIQKNETKAGPYFLKAKNDIIEILGYCKDKKQLNFVAQFLINNNPDCRFNKIILSVEKANSRKLYVKIYLEVLKIVYDLLLLKDKDNKESAFVHYTTRKTASMLVLDKSPFRLFSVLTTNDLTEGQTLFDFLTINTSKLDTNDSNLQAFIGCFSFNENSLNQFRLYGKEDSKEGTGVSIALDHHFFSPDMCLDILPNGQKEEEQKYNNFPIFRCLYLDPNDSNFLWVGHKDNKSIKLKDIKKRLENIKGLVTKEDIDVNILKNLFLILRYLVKNAAFKEEQECRIICIEDIDDDAKAPQKNKQIHFSPDYSQMYIEYHEMNDTNLKRVVFGPKAQGYGIFKKALEYKDIKCDCIKSELPLA